MRPLAMRPFLLLPMLFLGLLLPFTGAQAVKIDDLHRSTVEVVDKSGEERTQAFRTGLERVLVKMAGSAAVVDRDGIEQLLERPEQFVQRYRYEPIEEPAGADATDGDAGAADAEEGPRFRLVITYTGGPIERRLEDMDVVVWGEERPEVLVWLAIDDGRERRVLDADGDSRAHEALMEAAGRRALPVMLPLMDARDRGEVEFVDISGGFFDTLETASDRYRGDTLLVGHLRRGGGEWRADWTLIGAGERRAWGAAAGDIGAAVDTGVDGATERLAAMLAGEGGERTRLSARIKGVGSLDDYARVKEYIEGLVRIRSVALRAIQPQELVFDMEVRGGLGEFERAVALGNVLEKIERRDSGDRDGGAQGDAADSSTTGDAAVDSGDAPATGADTNTASGDGTAAGAGGAAEAPRTQIVFRLTD